MKKMLKKWARTGTETRDDIYDKLSGAGGGSKFSRSNKIKEVQTKPKKSLKNQKPAKNKEDEFLKEFEGKSLPKHGDYMGPRKKSLLKSKVKGRKDYEDLFGPWLKKDL